MRKSLELSLPCKETSSWKFSICFFFPPLFCFQNIFNPVKAIVWKWRFCPFVLWNICKKQFYLSAWLLYDTIFMIILRHFNIWVLPWISNINFFVVVVIFFLLFFNLVLFYWRHQVYNTDSESTAPSYISTKKIHFSR